MQQNGEFPSSAIIGVMAKYWQPGRVKTRLGASIGMDRAANLHELFVHHLLSELGLPGSGQPRSAQGRAVEQNWDLQWVVSPPESIDQCRQQIAQWNLDAITIADQGEGDLGDRMERWFKQCSQTRESQIHQSLGGSDPPPKSCDSGYAKAILIGADCPLLSRDDIADAFDRLDHSDGVLGPAADGGYYLVGLKLPTLQDVHQIFANMIWSREDVFDVTCQRIKEIGMSVSILPTLEDVDTKSELIRLRQSLADPRWEHNEATKQLRNEIDRIMIDRNTGISDEA